VTNSFDFGANWLDFSQSVLDQDRLVQASQSLETLLGPGALKGQSFIDVGSGTGLFSLAAKKNGAGPVIGLDINPTCIAVAQKNAIRFGLHDQTQFCQINILDTAQVSQLSPANIVYAWGSLHHTGQLSLALQNTASLVKPNGYLIVAIYNKHWSSPWWRRIKHAYVSAPRFCQKILIGLMLPIIAAAKFAVTGKNPFKKERGMDFRIDVIDWVGGYPYEYASPSEMTERLAALGFELQKMTLPAAPTGCVEYVCRKK